MTLCDPIACTVCGILQTKILEWVAFLSPGDLPNPEIEPRSPSLQADSLPVELQRKPKNTGVGSLSLLQGIFLTQELNWGLLTLQVDSLPNMCVCICICTCVRVRVWYHICRILKNDTYILICTIEKDSGTYSYRGEGWREG